VFWVHDSSNLSSDLSSFYTGDSQCWWFIILATVITNLLSAIPIFGQDIVELIWGGFSVSNATLNRFFSLHYLLPFLLAALAVAHLIAQL